MKELLRHIGIALVLPLLALIGTVLLLIEALFPTIRKNKRGLVSIKGFLGRYVDVLGRWNILP